MVDLARHYGRRGLPGGSSLARLLAEHQGRPPYGQRRLTTRQILAGADSHHLRTGVWPTGNSGPVQEVSGDTWGAINAALSVGCRGLRGGSSLARLLAKHRGRRNRKGLPPFSVQQILAWADIHHRRTGHFPIITSGSVYDANGQDTGETWKNINKALELGQRGLPGGSSLHRLLMKFGGKPGKKRTADGP